MLRSDPTGKPNCATAKAEYNPAAHGPKLATQVPREAAEGPPARGLGSERKIPHRRRLPSESGRGGAAVSRGTGHHGCHVSDDEDMVGEEIRGAASFFCRCLLPQISKNECGVQSEAWLHPGADSAVGAQTHGRTESHAPVHPCADSAAVLFFRKMFIKKLISFLMKI